jgi:hypothetical protein
LPSTLQHDYLTSSCLLLGSTYSATPPLRCSPIISTMSTHHRGFCQDQTTSTALKPAIRTQCAHLIPPHGCGFGQQHVNNPNSYPPTPLDLLTVNRHSTRAHYHYLAGTHHASHRITSHSRRQVICHELRVAYTHPLDLGHSTLQEMDHNSRDGFVEMIEGQELLLDLLFDGWLRDRG